MTRTVARSCRSKHAHSTRQYALAQLRQLVAAGAHHEALDIYHCRTCRRWHVGHRPHRKRQRWRRIQ